jgi:polyhydroxyalkanoate synthesis regulator phasin
MKRFILIAVLVGALAALLAGTALAAGPVTPPAQGFGPGMGMRAAAAGSTAPDVDDPCGVVAGMAGPQGRGKPAWAGQPDEVAALLGMKVEDIQAQRQAGKSLVAIADSKGVGEDQLINTILDAKKAILAELVDDGKLTQAQADLMVEHMQAQVKTMVERTTVGPMQEQQGMGRMQSGMGRGQAGMGQGFRGGRGAGRTNNTLSW